MQRQLCISVALQWPSRLHGPAGAPAGSQRAAVPRSPPQRHWLPQAGCHVRSDLEAARRCRGWRRTPRRTPLHPSPQIMQPCASRHQLLTEGFAPTTLLCCSAPAALQSATCPPSPAHLLANHYHGPASHLSQSPSHPASHPSRAPPLHHHMSPPQPSLPSLCLHHNRCCFSGVAHTTPASQVAPAKACNVAVWTSPEPGAGLCCTPAVHTHVVMTVATAQSPGEWCGIATSAAEQ